MKNRPAVKIFIPYLFGIVLADRFNLNIIHLWILLIVSTPFLLLLYKKKYFLTSSLLLTIFLLLVGFLRYEISMIPPDGLHNVLYKQVMIKGNIIECKQERTGGSSLIVSGTASLVSDPSINISGKISIRSWDENFAKEYGDIIEMEGILSCPRPQRNPGVFDYQKYMMRRGIFAAMTINDISNVRTIGTGGNIFLRWTKMMRRRIESIIDEIIPSEENASILKGITLGDRSDLSPEMYESFLKTSTNHILAVSGLHIGTIALAIFILLSWIKRRFELRNTYFIYIIMVPVCIIYTSMVGQISAVRATILVILFSIAACIDRDGDILNLLAVAALIVLINRPGAFWDASFRLSFSAVASIAYLMPRWESWLVRIRNDKWYRRVLYKMSQAIAVSWSAQIGVMLIIAYTFGRISLLGAFINPIAVPFAMAIVPIGFVSYIAGMVYLPLAIPLGYLNHILISILKFIISYFAGFQMAQIPVYGFSLGHIIISLAVIIFIINFPILLKQKQKLVIASILFQTLFRKTRK